MSNVGAGRSSTQPPADATTRMSGLDGLDLRSDHPPSRVIQSLRQLKAADSAGVAVLLAQECVVVDHRQTGAGTFNDGDSLVEVVANLGHSDFHLRLIAVRGDNLALVRLMFDRPEGGVSDTLVVARCTNDGRLCEVSAFDVAQASEAAAYLGACYRSTLDETVTQAIQTCSAFLGAVVGGDLDALARFMSEDFRHVDFREGAVLHLDGAATVDLVESVRAVDEHIIDIVVEVHELTPWGLVASRTQATAERLGISDNEIVLMGVRGNLVHLMEFHDIDELPVALARLARLRQT